MTSFTEARNQIKNNPKEIIHLLDAEALDSAVTQIKIIIAKSIEEKDRAPALEMLNIIKDHKLTCFFFQNKFAETPYSKSMINLAIAIIQILDFLEFQGEIVKVQSWICGHAETTPNDYWSLYKYQVKANRPAREIIITIKRLCISDASNPEAWFIASNLYLNLGEMGKAQECCQHSIRLAPSNDTYKKWCHVNFSNEVTLTLQNSLNKTAGTKHNTSTNIFDIISGIEAPIKKIEAQLKSLDVKVTKIERRRITHKIVRLYNHLAKYVYKPLLSLKNNTRINVYLPNLSFSPPSFPQKKQNPKRLLIIFNMETMPYSVGECFYMYEAALCKYPSANKTGFDVAFVADIAKPAREDQGTHKYNYFEKLQDLASTANFPNNIHSSFIFGDRKQFERFITDNEKKYTYWPSLKDFKNNELAYQKNVPVINAVFEKKGFIPLLKARPILEDRMRKLILDNTNGEFPVCVHLRLNKAHRDERRNSDIQSWKIFFERCKEEGMNVKFFIICGSKELREPELKQLETLQNIFLVKPTNTTVSDDFALSIVAGAFLGGPSGPSVAVMYSDRPYVLFNYKKETSFHFVGTGPGKNYQFALDNQELIWKRETPEIIYEQFTKIYKKIDKDKYFEELNTPKRTKGSIESIHALR